MFCTNCGVQMNDGAAICISCGFAKNTGVNYCGTCGAQRNPGAVVCVKCGCALRGANAPTSAKKRVTAALFYFLLGPVGVGDFYLGYTSHAIIKLVITVVTFGFGAIGTGIWSIIDGVKCLQRQKKDAQGRELVD